MQEEEVTCQCVISGTSEQEESGVKWGFWYRCEVTQSWKISLSLKLNCRHWAGLFQVNSESLLSFDFIAPDLVCILRLNLSILTEVLNSCFTWNYHICHQRCPFHLVNEGGCQWHLISFLIVPGIDLFHHNRGRLRVNHTAVHLMCSSDQVRMAGSLSSRV